MYNVSTIRRNKSNRPLAINYIMAALINTYFSYSYIAIILRDVKRNDTITTMSKILIVTTSHAQIEANNKATGLWLEELTTPYYVFVDAGLSVTIASIKGGEIPVDPHE